MGGGRRGRWRCGWRCRTIATATAVVSGCRGWVARSRRRYATRGRKIHCCCACGWCNIGQVGRRRSCASCDRTASSASRIRVSIGSSLILACIHLAGRQLVAGRNIWHRTKTTTTTTTHCSSSSSSSSSALNTTHSTCSNPASPNPHPHPSSHGHTPTTTTHTPILASTTSIRRRGGRPCLGTRADIATAVRSACSCGSGGPSSTPHRP